jgi:hypothetical protein
MGMKDIEPENVVLQMLLLRESLRAIGRQL